MIAKVIMLSLYVTYVTAGALLQSSPFQSCGEGIPTPYFFSLSTCPATASICPFYMGVPINTMFTFTIPDETQSLKVSASVQFPEGVYSGWLPYVGFLKEGCWDGWDNYQCPARRGQSASYSTGNMTVPAISGSENVKLNVKFTMKDDKQNNVFCLIVNTILKNI